MLQYFQWLVILERLVVLLVLLPPVLPEVLFLPVLLVDLWHLDLLSYLYYLLGYYLEPLEVLVLLVDPVILVTLVVLELL